VPETLHGPTSPRTLQPQGSDWVDKPVGGWAHWFVMRTTGLVLLLM